MAIKYEEIIPLPIDFYLNQVAPGQINMNQLIRKEIEVFTVLEGVFENFNIETLIRISIY